jgi:hypothetical protein
MANRQHWREIERALISVLRDYGIEIIEERGDRFVNLRQGTSPSVEYRLSDFARELEERL